MEHSDINEAVVQDCPFCRKEHIVSQYVKNASLEIKGEFIEYIEKGFMCPITQSDDGNSWASGKTFFENLLRARDAYRIKHSLLTSSEIVEIRKKYGLSQKELSNLLGWGDVTVARYETKLIQDETSDNLLRMVASNPSLVLDGF